MGDQGQKVELTMELPVDVVVASWLGGAIGALWPSAVFKGRPGQLIIEFPDEPPPAGAADRLLEFAKSKAEDADDADADEDGDW